MKNDKETKLNEEKLEKVAGGMSPGEEYITEEDVEYCFGSYEYGKHEWIKTGNHKEESFFFFWTKGLDECKCSKCGATKWISD